MGTRSRTPLFYRICGRTVRSELELPSAVVADRPTGRVDISIRYDAVPPHLPDATATGPTWDMAGPRFLLRVPRIGQFLMTDGREMAVELAPGASERDATGFVLGTAFGLLLHQRGAFVLHGAAVAADGRAVAICGASGAGKSTLAAALCSDGCALVADDLCVIDLDEGRRPIVLPDGRRLKLWTQAIERLNLTALPRNAVREGFEKYYIEPFETALSPARLSAIYVLREARPPHKPGIEQLTLPDALRALEREAYRPGLRARMSRSADLLAHTAAIFAHARAFVVRSPRGFAELPRTVASMRAHWNAMA